MTSKKVKYDNGQILDGANGKIMVGIPRERVTFNKFLDNRDSILAHLHAQNRGTQYYQSESHRVDRNRDDIARHFLDHPQKPEWLWMIDTDMDHPIDAGIRLTRHNKPIVGALYFHRGETHDPFVFEYAGKYPDKYGRKVHQWKPLRDEVYKFLEDNFIPLRDGSITIDNPIGEALWKVDAVATGSMVIHRSVLEVMKEPWFEYRDYGTSEDLMFCYEAMNNYDIPIYADVSTICGHYNWVAMGQAQFRTMYLGRGINQTSFTMNQMYKWVEDFLGLSKEEAKAKVDSSNAHMVGSYWRGRFKDKEPTKEEVEAFYKEDYTGELYLLELLNWNRSPVFHQIRQMIMQVRNKNVIEIGGGIGSVAIQLAVQKNNVVTVEPNELLRRFIAHRAKIHYEMSATELGKLDVVGDWIGEYQDEQFDEAVSFDTFEHIHIVDIPPILKELNRILRPGGSLFYHANFEQQDIYPMHFDHSELWPDMLIEAGFSPQTDVVAIKVK